jgi:hypothetical protein
MGIPRRCRRRRRETYRHAWVRFRGAADRWWWEALHGKLTRVAMAYANPRSPDFRAWWEPIGAGSACGTIGFGRAGTKRWTLSIRNAHILNEALAARRALN